eukprot:CAMPEP_0180425892 /NCGR_PEP_ID=MMETSP1036_2-20121128/5506_1 /TAXON_ID=632150 /ORGANISM="Azadinium spinosum, Strain 3D9" /LENGTH=48 /DNA_ID= /DNA_START= /DNA_END= /DNA_ORIENTATION=
MSGWTYLSEQEENTCLTRKPSRSISALKSFATSSATAPAGTKAIKSKS